MRRGVSRGQALLAAAALIPSGSRGRCCASHGTAGREGARRRQASGDNIAVSAATGPHDPMTMTGIPTVDAAATAALRQQAAPEPP